MYFVSSNEPKKREFPIGGTPGNALWTPASTDAGVQKMNLLWSVLIFLLNFFFLDRDPKKCARYHGDKHLNKMILEYAQIASTCFWIVGHQHDTLYKPTHKRHPIVLWASKSLANVKAVIELGLALGEERNQRLVIARKLGKKWLPEHSSVKVLEFMKNNLPPSSAFEYEDMWMDPPLCMPACLHGKGIDVVDCYRLFYCGHKVDVTGIKWDPYVEPPYFYQEYKRRISEMPEVVKDIESEQSKKAKVSKKKRKISDPSLGDGSESK